MTEENIRRVFGVNAVIGGVETRESVLPNVVPLSISGLDVEECGDEDMIASTTVITGLDAAEGINALLHEYSHLLIGRMGMPYRKGGVYIIHVMLHGSVNEINALTHSLKLLPGVSVKTTFARTGGKETPYD